MRRSIAALAGLVWLCGTTARGGYPDRSTSIERELGPRFYGADFAAKLLAAHPLVLEARVLGQETAPVTLSGPCWSYFSGTHPAATFARMVVQSVHVGISPAETLVVMQGVSHPADVFHPGDRVLFLGEFGCVGGDTAWGDTEPSPPPEGRYSMTGYQFAGIDIMRRYGTGFTTRELHAAASTPEAFERRRALADLNSLLLCRLLQRQGTRGGGDSVICEPLVSLFGPLPAESKISIVFTSPSGRGVADGDTIVVPLHRGELKEGHEIPLRVADLTLREGFVPQFGCTYDRILELCYFESGGFLVPRHQPG